MRRAALVIATCLGSLALADPPASLALDAPLLSGTRPAACTAPSCRRLGSERLGSDDVELFQTNNGDEDIADVAIAGRYFFVTVMHYIPGMGERSAVVQTRRNWSVAPKLSTGTLGDGSSAAIIRIPWTSREYSRDTNKYLGPPVWHEVLVVCAAGAAPACSTALSLDCPSQGCTTKLDRGVLSVGPTRYRVAR
jgi:hypothetical protein